jgi:hypothetical protein
MHRQACFLSLPGEIMYLYLPAYGKERRIAYHRITRILRDQISVKGHGIKNCTQKGMIAAVSVKDDGDT